MKRIDNEIENDIIKMYLEGYSCREVSEEYNTNPSTVFNILKRNGIDIRTKGGIIKLPVNKIINDYNNGIRITDIAKQYNVNIKTIYNYLDKAGIERNYIYINRSLRRDYFKNIDSIDKAYFLGFIISDGCAQKDNNLTICIQKRDYYILEIFRQCIQNENPLYFNPVRNEVTFHCKSKELLDDLSKYGVVPCKSLITYLPLLHENMMPHLIRGIFDGNGWFSSKSQSLGYCAGNKTIVTQFRDFLVYTLNVYPVKVIQRDIHTFQISWSSIKDIVKIANYMYNFAFNYYLRRKFEEYKIICDNTEITNYIT